MRAGRSESEDSRHCPQHHSCPISRAVSVIRCCSSTKARLAVLTAALLCCAASFVRAGRTLRYRTGRYLQLRGRPATKPPAPSQRQRRPPSAAPPGPSAPGFSGLDATRPNGSVPAPSSQPWKSPPASTGTGCRLLSLCIRRSSWYRYFRGRLPAPHSH